MIPLETAREYFSNHLLGELFLESDGTLAASALTMAARDVSSRLLRPADESDPRFVAAVCEQALFLLTRKERLLENQAIVSESVEGLGSRSYTSPVSGRDLVLAPRAALYIDDLNAGKTLPITRG
ncbi:MAG: hypothetical protein IJU70_11610 [Lentisphaeria bacterium]|nr:hypothetical protein [Lentisphaeria bacterium]